MMVDFSKIADRVKDVDKIKFADLKKETEMKLKMINVVERLCKKYASGLVEMASEVIDKSMEFLQTVLSTFNEYKKNVQIKMIPFKNASLRDSFGELPSVQNFNENYKKVCKMIENKEITEINTDSVIFQW